jgi:hypothetical protein
MRVFGILLTLRSCPGSITLLLRCSSRRFKPGLGASLPSCIPPLPLTLRSCDSRLKEYKDTSKLLIFTLDLTTHTYPIITSVPSLPYDCLSLVPCTTSLGGLVIISANAIVYVDQAARRVVLPVNGWAGRISDVPLPALTPDEQGRNLELEGSRAAFVDDRTFFLILRDGTVYPVELVTDGGKTVSKLSMGPPLANTTVPALVRPVGNDCLFVGSTVGPSVLLQAARVQEVDQAQGMKTAVVDIVLDDDDGTASSPKNSGNIVIHVFSLRRHLWRLPTHSLPYPPKQRRQDTDCRPPLPVRFPPRIWRDLGHEVLIG